MLAIVAAAVLYLVYEMPAVNLERFFGRNATRSQSKHPNGHSKKSEVLSVPDKFPEVVTVKPQDESKL